MKPVPLKLLPIAVVALASSVHAQSPAMTEQQFSDVLAKTKDAVVTEQVAASQQCVLPPGYVGLGQFCAPERVITVAKASRNLEQLSALDAAYKTQTATVQDQSVLIAQTNGNLTKANGELSNTKAQLAQASSDLAATKAKLQVLTNTELGKQGAADPKAVQIWQILISDVTLANTVQRWGRQSGWQVRWDATKNVLVEAPGALEGTFEEVIRALLESPGIASSSYPLEVCFYSNTPPLARITRKGDQDQECQK